MGPHATLGCTPLEQDGDKMTKVKPIPCPVCGKLPKVSPWAIAPQAWRAQCERANLTTYHCTTADGKGEEAAIKNWNRYVGRGK